MARQTKVDAVPDVGELGVMIDLLGVQRDAREEPECLAEILELEGTYQCFATLLESPALRSVHRDSPVLQPPPSLKRHSMTSSSRFPFASALSSHMRGLTRARRTTN